MFLEEHQFNIILPCFKENLDNYVFNIFTCALLASSSKTCRIFLNFVFVYIELFSFVDLIQGIFQFLLIFPSQNLKLV